MTLDSWQEIWATVRKNKLRTFLTAAGVFWGVFMLVIMLGFGGGLERGVASNMRGFASNTMYLWARQTSLPYLGMQPGRRIQLMVDDADAIRDSIANIKYLAPRATLGGWRGGDNVTRGAITGDFQISGDYPEIQHIQGMLFPRGRFIDYLDIRDKRKVAVIGPRAYKELYRPGENPLGSSINIRGVYFTVVGLFEPIVGSGHMKEALESTVFVPFTTYQQAFNQGGAVGVFAITAADGTSVEALQEEVKALVAKRHQIHPDDATALGGFHGARRFGDITAVFSGINLLVWVVGIATLLAGVIGVTNIMLIAVKERTKEIGIRKALGATPLSVIAQIVQESTVLTAIAGYLGLAASVATLSVVDRWVGESSEMLRNPQVDFGVAMIATGVLIGAGALAGVIPARHAVKVNPVEALRAE